MSTFRRHHVSSIAVVIAIASGCASGGTAMNPSMSGGIRAIGTGAATNSTLASTPEFTTAYRSSVALPAAEVLKRLLVAYDAVGIPLTVADQATRTVGNEGMRRTRTLAGKRLSEYLSCGTGSSGGPNADLYAVTMSVVSQVHVVTDNSSEVATMVQATAAPMTFGTPPVPCSTTNALEDRLVALVRDPAGAKP